MNSQGSIQCDGPSRFANVPDGGKADRSSGARSGRIPGGRGVPRCGFVVLLLIPLMSSGCMTSALWNSADPGERVWVSASKTTEGQLKERGLRYTKYRFEGEQLRDHGILCDAEVVEGFLVEKTEFQKFGDTLFRIAATPFTLTVDACCGIFVAVVSDPTTVGSLLECAFN